MGSELRLVLCAAAASLLAACVGVDDPAAGGDTSVDADADTDTDSDTDSDTDADAGPDTGSDTGCDMQDLPLIENAARVMLLLDRSSSMAGGNLATAVTALTELLEAYVGSNLEFGLDVLPDFGGSCAVDAPVLVDCGPGTNAEIEGELASMTTDVSTPLDTALLKLTDPAYAPGLLTDDTSDYIVLVADGEDSCTSPSPAELAATTSGLVALGIRVMVIGFNVNVSSEQLDTIAANGGTTFTEYLNATDEASLVAALNAMGATIAQCVWNIDAPDASANPDLVNFYFDGVVLPYDEGCSSGAGWRWANDEHTQVEFCADSCALVTGGEVDDITAIFGCDTVVE